MRYGKGNVQNELGKNTNYLLYQLGLTAARMVSGSMAFLSI